MMETAEVAVRYVEHNRILEIFYRDPKRGKGGILTNVGDACSGHDAIVATEIEAGVPGEVVEREIDPGAFGISRLPGGFNRSWRHNEDYPGSL